MCRSALLWLTLALCTACTSEFRKRKRDEVPEDFLCNVRHANNLPDVPFDPKLLAYPFESDRFTRYKGTSLESATNLGIRTEPDLGIHVDLLDPYAYVPPNASGAPVNPVDQELIDVRSCKLYVSLCPLCGFEIITLYYTPLAAVDVCLTLSISLSTPPPPPPLHTHCYCYYLRRTGPTDACC